MAKVLKVTKCSDGMMWYADMVGQTVPYLGVWSDSLDVYVSREPAGYVNIVKKVDAEIVEE